LIQQAGLREILIQRQGHFNRWANPAFWMSLTLGCMGALIMVMLAPVAAWMYEDWRLLGLVLLLALSTPFAGLDIVPDAKLTSELRFRYLAWVKWLTAVGTMGLSIVFAKMGWGATASFCRCRSSRCCGWYCCGRPPARRFAGICTFRAGSI
jgi:O-antigen/teichoic acid export membrane protein